jgi:thiamine biosynthesis protein ThiI
MKALLLLSGGIDSPVAGHLMKKKMEVLAVHFSLEPFTDNEPEVKSRKLAQTLGFGKLHVINISKELKQITEKCDRKYYFVLMKRVMFRKSEELAKKLNCKFLITGENLGQVSSQTLENLYAIDTVATIPILRPLITKDKQEIIEIAEKINTFEISKGKECCDVLGPDKPSTKARLEKIIHEEAGLL